MLIGFKSVLKLLGVTIITFCAVFVCMLFMNFNLDMNNIKDLIVSKEAMLFYDAQAVMGKSISAISGCCLLLTSVVMLFSYIKHFIDAHAKELGILKALGYSSLKIASNFWAFGLSVLFGTALGFCGSFILMPTFYEAMTKDSPLPSVIPHFNAILVLLLVILPSFAFGLLSVIYSLIKLRCPALTLIRGKAEKVHLRKQKDKPQSKETTFLTDLKRGVIRSRRSLVFMIAFAAFCFSAMMQMVFTMSDFSSTMFVAIVFFIGIILSFTILLLAVTTVVNSNSKHISIMKVFGYSFKSCSSAILNGYRPIAYIGFAVGTVYQYFLINLVVNIYASTAEAIPKKDFNIAAFFIVLAAFVVIYEAIMYVYSAKIKNISIKEIMLD